MKIFTNFITDSFSAMTTNTIIDCIKEIDEIELCDSYKEADLILCHHSIYKKKDIPTIIVERADSATVMHRHLLEMKDVVGMIKGANLNPMELNNSNLIMKKYHYCLIDNEDSYRCEYDKLKENLFPKIKTLIPLSMQKYLEPLKDIEFNEKPIDICISFSKHNRNKYVAKHRQLAIDAAEKLSCKKVIHYEPIPYKDWIDLLLQSKICLSPWGYGECCFRDFESIYCGAIVVKPLSNFIETYPNIYKKEYYFPCNTDFSNLSEIVEEILCYKNHPIKFFAKNFLCDFWNYKERGSDMVGFFKTTIKDF